MSPRKIGPAMHMAPGGGDPGLGRGKLQIGRRELRRAGRGGEAGAQGDDCVPRRAATGGEGCVPNAEGHWVWPQDPRSPRLGHT